MWQKHLYHLLFPAGERTPWAVLARTLRANPRSLWVPWRESLAPTNGGCTDDLFQGIMAEVGGFHGKYEQAGIRVLPGLRYFPCI